MPSHHNFRRCTLFLMLLLCCASARAQRFEFFSTNTGTNDDGRYGVTNLTVVAGYAATGGTDVTCVGGNVNKDVLVTRQNLNGNATAGWPRAYDIGGVCGNDFGKCIIECRAVAATAGNLVIVGQTGVNCGFGSANNAFLMSITNAGAVNWVRVFPNVVVDRVVEATIGVAALGTAPGDLIFCGHAVGAGGVSLPLIARTTNAGVLIWNRTYLLGDNSTGHFFDVVQCVVPVGGIGAGDVAAAGVVNTVGSIIRVNGNTGLLGAAPLGLGQYGAANAMRLRSLQELKVGANAADLVACGDNANLDIYVLETTNDPCVPVADVTYTAGNSEEAWNLREIIPGAFSGLTAGNIIVTGWTRVVVGGVLQNPDVFLLELNPATLAVAAGGVGFHIYDAAGSGSTDRGFSVMPVYRQGVAIPPTDGFIFCGVSDQNPAGLGMEMYIVKTGALGNEAPGCDDGTVGYQTTTPGLGVVCSDPPTAQPLVSCQSNAAQVAVGWVRPCYNLPKPATPDETPSVGEALTLSSLPNPVGNGNDFTLTIAAANAAPAVLKIVDMSGNLIATLDESLRAGEHHLVVSTKGWSSGMYIVTVTSGERTAMTRIVVE